MQNYHTPQLFVVLSYSLFINWLFKLLGVWLNKRRAISNPTRVCIKIFVIEQKLAKIWLISRGISAFVATWKNYLPFL